MPELFPFDNYEIGLGVIGIIMLIAAFVPQILLKRRSTFAFVQLGLGALLFAFIPHDILNPFTEDHRWLWEKGTEFVVIVSLLGAGLKIDEPFSWKYWRTPLRLIYLLMPLTILFTALTGHYIIGLPVASAILLGAVIAPTDPVLAADIQVSAPTEGEGEHVKFPLTAEAGINDGFAFPFTYLAVGFAAYGAFEWGWFGKWFAIEFVYKILVGVGVGVVLGWLLNKFVFKYPREKPLSAESMGCVAIAILFTTYGLAEIVGGYGFLAVFSGAFVFRKLAEKDHYNMVLHEFSENLEHTVMSILLVFLGGLTISVFPFLTWECVVAGLLLLFVIRPVLGYLSLLGCTEHPPRERLAIGFFGVRGLGSVYYLAYAFGHEPFGMGEEIWATVLFVICVSSVVHGLGAIPVMDWLGEKEEEFGDEPINELEEAMT